METAARVSQRRRTPKRLAEGTAAGGADPYQMKAIHRALDVLECFPDASARLNLREISQRIGHPESSLFRILRTLESRGYLRQDRDGAYQLPRRLLLGLLEQQAEQCRELAHPFLVELRDRFNETASSAFLYGDRIQVLDTVESVDDVRATNTPGRVVPPHCSSLGKAVTAYQAPALADRILEAYGLTRRTPASITDRRALLEEFEQVRRAGYAVDREESVAGGVCLGAPVWRGGAVAAALSVSAPVVRMSPERETEIAKQLVAAAARLSGLLTARGLSGR